MALYIKKLSWVLFLMLVTYSVYSKDIDSLTSLINGDRSNYEKIDLLTKLTRQYINNNEYDNAIASANSTINISKWENSNKAIIDSYMLLGYSYFFKNNYPKALESYLFASIYLKKQPDDYQLAKAFNNIALLYNVLSIPDKALYYSDKSLQHLDRINDYNLLIDCYTNLADAYHLLQNFQKTEEFIKKGIELKEESSVVSDLGIEYNKLASLYFRIKDYKLAKDYFNKYHEISLKIGDSLGIARSIHNLGSTSYAEGKYVESINYFQNAIEINQTNISLTYTELVYSWIKLNKLKKAEYYFNLANTSENVSMTELTKACQALIDAFLNSGKKDQALSYYSVLNKLKDQNTNESSTTATQASIAKFQVEGIEERVLDKINSDLLKKNLELQSNYNNILIFLAILLLLVIISIAYLYRRNKQQHLSKLSDLKKTALTMEKFLFPEKSRRVF
jgi:tetratricopeptide (TPR) repeat protein